MAGRSAKAVVEPFFTEARDLQLVQHVLVLVHVLRLANANIFHVKLEHGGDVRAPRNYGNMNDASLHTLHHQCSHKYK